MNFFKTLNEWGTNKRLIREVAERLHLNLKEHAGWQTSWAGGSFDSFDIEISGRPLNIGTGMPIQSTQVCLIRKGTGLPRALILVADSKKMKHVLGDFLRGFFEARLNGIILKTAEMDKTFYLDFLSRFEGRRQMENYLNEKRGLAPFITIEEDHVIYTKPFVYNRSSALSADELVKIATFMSGFLKQLASLV